MLLLFAKLLGPPALLLLTTVIHDDFARRIVFLPLGIVIAICHLAIRITAGSDLPSDGNSSHFWNVALVVVPWTVSLFAFAMLRPRSRTNAILAFPVVYFVALVGAPTTGVWLGLLAK